MSRWTLPFATAEANQLRQHPTAATLTRAVVLRRCALETLRLTAHTIGAVRLALEPFVLRSGETEYTIQAGETIAISHIASSLDTELWGSDVESWDPWRDEWAVIHDNSVRRAGLASVLRSGVDDFKFTVFSHGIHRCPGERLALAVVQLTVAELMKHEVALVGALPPLSFERATLAQRAGPVAATIRPRQEPEPGQVAVARCSGHHLELRSRLAPDCRPRPAPPERPLAPDSPNSLAAPRFVPGPAAAE